MKNWQILITCLLEEFELAIGILLGAGLMWVLLLRTDLVVWYVVGVLVIGLAFNVVTELLWRKR